MIYNFLCMQEYNSNLHYKMFPQTASVKWNALSGEGKLKMTKQIIFTNAGHPFEIIIQIGNSFWHFYVISPLFSHGLCVPSYTFLLRDCSFTFNLSAARLPHCFLPRVENDLWHRKIQMKGFQPETAVFAQVSSVSQNNCSISLSVNITIAWKMT